MTGTPSTIAAGLFLSILLLTAAHAVWSAREGSLAPAAEYVNEETAVGWTSIEVASGPAYQGPWRMNQSDFRYVDAPAAAVDHEGGIAVAWVDQRRRDVVFQRYDPSGASLFAEPSNVSRTPDTFSWLPRIALDPRDPARVFVLWQEIVFSGGSHGGEIFLARSTDGGQSFEEPVNLSRTPAGAGKGRLSPERWDNGSLDLLVTPGGELVAAWTEYEGALRVARSTDGGAEFSRPLLVAGSEGEPPARGPSLAAGPEGVVYLAWTVGEDPSADIRLARSDDGGASFGEPVIPFRGESRADAPKLAGAHDGTLHLAFSEEEGGPGGTLRVRYARLLPEETLAAPADPGGTGLLTLSGPFPGEGAGYPHLALDSTGNPHLVWELFPHAGGRPAGLALASSDDGGESFGPAALVPGTRGAELGFNGGLQGLLSEKLAIGPGGGPGGRIVVASDSFNPGERSRIRLLVRDTPPE